MPIVLTNAVTGAQFIIKLYALVLPNLLMGMFISKNGLSFIKSEGWGRGGITYTFNFGNGGDIKVVHRLQN